MIIALPTSGVFFNINPPLTLSIVSTRLSTTFQSLGLDCFIVDIVSASKVWGLNHRSSMTLLRDTPLQAQQRRALIPKLHHKQACCRRDRGPSRRVL